MNSSEYFEKFVETDKFYKEDSPKPTLLRDAKSITMSRGLRINSRQQIRELVELPLASAAEILFNKKFKS